jgi:hypothetical protein
VLLTTLHIPDPQLFELTSLLGFDGIWLDLEHHGFTEETAANLARATRVGSSDIMIRPAKGEFMKMCRLFEIGATGIMYPRCDNAEEAAEVVKWAKFAPQGQRGIDSAGADNPLYDALTGTCQLPTPRRLSSSRLKIPIPTPKRHDRPPGVTFSSAAAITAFWPGSWPDGARHHQGGDAEWRRRREVRQGLGMPISRLSTRSR